MSTCMLRLVFANRTAHVLRDFPGRMQGQIGIKEWNLLCLGFIRLPIAFFL